MPIHAMIEQEKDAADGARGAARMHMRLETSGSLDGDEGATVIIHNLSATGMLIETTSDLEIGQRIAVSLPETPDCTATIVWRSEALAGCRFDRPISRAALSAAQLRNPLPQDVDPATVRFTELRRYVLGMGKRQDDAAPQQSDRARRRVWRIRTRASCRSARRRFDRTVGDDEPAA